MLDGEKIHPSQYYDLHLVWHRLNEIIEQNEDQLQDSVSIVDEIVATRRLVRSLLRGYETDVEA